LTSCHAGVTQSLSGQGGGATPPPSAGSVALPTLRRGRVSSTRESCTGTSIASTRAAWALCGSPHDAQDLIQETFLNVLKRPRMLRDGSDIGYLLRALRNTYSSHYRTSAHRRRDRSLTEDDAVAYHDGGFETRELMDAIASAPAAYRDAIVAVDLVGLSYREAADTLGTRESTITTRLHRGRQHVARALQGELRRSLSPLAI
jgi:RNA polymerase sigma-70 factor (ECF subfamily)